MNMGIGYKIIEDLILIELGLIIIIVLLTFILKFAADRNRKKKQENKTKLENHLKKMIAENKPFSTKTFPRKWKKLPILFPVFANLDQTSKGPGWNKIREPLLKEVLLPAARRKAYSRRWIMRFFACKVFELSSEKKDEKALIKLAQDKVPLVYLHAVTAAVHSGSEKAIEIIIQRIAKVYWVIQFIYLEPFKKATKEEQAMVERYLLEATDPAIRTACYKVLLQFPKVGSKLDITKDLQSTSFELRLAVLKYITQFDEQAAIPLLIEKLKDDHWEVRLVALHRLGTLKVKKAMPQIADALNDQEWWVKMSAAEVLKSFGEEGEAILKTRSKELDLIPFDATKHIPHTLW